MAPGNLPVKEPMVKPGEISVAGTPPEEVMSMSLQRMHDDLNRVCQISQEEQRRAVKIAVDMIEEGTQAVNEKGKPDHAIRLAYFRELTNMFGLSMADRLKMMEGFERLVSRTMTHSERNKKLDLAGIRSAISPHAKSELGI